MRAPVKWRWRLPSVEAAGASAARTSSDIRLVRCAHASCMQQVGVQACRRARRAPRTLRLARRLASGGGACSPTAGSVSAAPSAQESKHSAATAGRGVTWLYCPGVRVPYPILPWCTQVYELMVPLDAPEVLEKTLDVLAQFAFAIRCRPTLNLLRHKAGCAAAGHAEVLEMARGVWRGTRLSSRRLRPTSHVRSQQAGIGA